MLYLENLPDNIEMINVGSTFSKFGFDYNYYGIRGFNFAGAPQTLKTDREIIEKYQGNLKKGAIIVVAVICPFVFCVYEYAKSKVTFYSKFIEFVKGKGKKLIAYGRSKKRTTQRQNLTAQELSLKNIDRRISEWMQEFDLQNVTTQKPTADLEKIFAKTRDELSKILEICKKCEFRPVLVSMPVTAEESCRFSDEFIFEFYEKNIAQINTEGVPFLHYFRDSRFSDFNLYENYADCLNEKGRQLFAQILIDDLKKLGLWGSGDE